MALFGKKDTGKSEKKSRPTIRASATGEMDLSKTMVRPIGQSPAAIIARDKYRKNLRSIIQKIHSAPNLDSILIDLKDEILSLVDAERITIYAVSDDGKNIYSRFKDGDDIQEIRVSLDTKSIAGYVATTKMPLMIEDAYNAKELGSIDSSLFFNREFDFASGFRTKQMLVVPLVLGNMLMGVIQLLNKKSGGNFTSEDKRAAMGIAESIALAFHNHRKNQSRQLSKYDALMAQEIVSRKDIEEAVQMSRESDRSVEAVLMKEFNVSKDKIGESLQMFYRVPFFAFDPRMPVPFDLLDNLEPGYLRNNSWTPIKCDSNHVTIAVDNPRALDKIDDIKRLFSQKTIEWMVSLPEDILKTIDFFWGAEVEEEEDTDAEFKEILEDAEEDIVGIAEEEIPDQVDESDHAIIRLVDHVIKDAHRQGASDIHIEPSVEKSDTLGIRFRIDGRCKPYKQVPGKAQRAIVSRLKIMADLDIANRLLPQDGKIQMKKFGGPNIELRVATIPTIGGTESVVIRLLASSEPIHLDLIGMLPSNIKTFKEMIHMPYGIVLVVGPTGSGKTTTLHSALGYINTPERKIWTAEDPVEITQKGLCQVQIHPKSGFTFARAMRAFLRADPDVIMIGEMRDHETASMAIEASLTGHIVFSTLHTNSAPETIVRLLDIGIDPFNFGDALLGVLAQRLVRTLCKKCRQESILTAEAFHEIVDEYGREDFSRQSLYQYTPGAKIYNAKGCNQCNEGYKGRMGIHELLRGSEEMTRYIHQKLTADKVRDLAIEQGMITLKQDGILKVLQGHTDIHQVRSVCIK